MPTSFLQLVNTALRGDAAALVFNDPTMEVIAATGANTGEWTPVDGSEDALTLVNNADAIWYKLGNLFYWGADVTYPATTGTGAAAIKGFDLAGLPPPTVGMGGINISLQTANIDGLSVYQDGEYLLFYGQDGEQVLNSALSQKSLSLSGWFVALPEF